MRSGILAAASFILAIATVGAYSSPARAASGLMKVKHLIYIMMENRTFDNQLGALPYAPGTPYHQCVTNQQKLHDHLCVDSLTCTADSNGNLNCANYNLNDQGEEIHAFDDPRICDASGLDHGWGAVHAEVNWEHPGDTFFSTPMDGFVRQNESDNPNQNVDYDTIGFSSWKEMPFYYALAEEFGIDDRYHVSVLGPTLPNRLYYMAATSFGHTTTGEAVPPFPAGYQPLSGTLLDLMEKRGVTWTNYYSDIPSSAYLRPYFSSHIEQISQLAADLDSDHFADVVYIDPNFGIIPPGPESDGSPPNNIRLAEYFVQQNISLIRNSQYWKDSIIFVNYDDPGGCYDHVPPPHVPQYGARTPDGIYPGQCEDLSNPPASTFPGGGANCSQSMSDAASTCPGFTPTGPYPKSCPAFDQYGPRCPFFAVSPFSKPHYVSHTLSDHTSLVALVEERFMTPHARGPHPALTLRDAKAKIPLDMFDFKHSPSLNATIPTAPPPSSSDDGCN
ncbi:MAG: alkaline phosphatase family protein [Candidatus Binataceae bacterium]